MCVSGQGNKGVCGNAEIGPQMARYALAGSAVGLATGLFLTWKYDKHDDKHEDNLAQTHPARGMPLPGALPVQTTDGRWSLVRVWCHRGSSRQLATVHCGGQHNQ